MTMLPYDPSRFPRSFADPVYANLARMVEDKLSLPKGILDAIRTRGERSNADQVSSAGARGPYQFIPPTRRAFVRQYGLDPWKDAPTQTEAAGKHLLEDYKRTGSWDEAIARYHGGQRPPTASRRYQERVGDFDNGVTNMAYGQSRYPAPYYGGPDPLAPQPDGPNTPEPPKDTMPVLADGGPSLPVAAGSNTVARKRGGILGALESVFMPDPGSRWAAALRGGLFDAKANQEAYHRGIAADDLKMMEAQAKLKNLLTKGEYQVVGNNVFHVRPDGSTEMIAPPQTPGEKERLIEHWRTMDANDPSKSLIERMLLGANAPDVIAEKGGEAQKTARIRADATTGSARIRATNKPASAAKPPAGFILD